MKEAILDQPETGTRWFSWITDSLTVAASKAQNKLDKGRQIRTRLAKAESAEVSLRQAVIAIEKLALDPKFLNMPPKRIRIKLLEILSEVDE